MTDTTGRATIIRWFEAMNRKDLDALDACVADGFVSHYMHSEGREAHLQYFQGLFESFPDLHAEVLDVVEQDGLVASRTLLTGTQEGEFGGIPATGRHVTVEGADFARVDAEGRLTEHWAYADSMVIMQQLGVVPQPA